MTAPTLVGVSVWLGRYNGPPRWGIERRRDVRGLLIFLGSRGIVVNMEMQ